MAAPNLHADLCRHLKLDPARVTCLTLTIPAGGAATVSADILADPDDLRPAVDSLRTYDLVERVPTTMGTRR